MSKLKLYYLFMFVGIQCLSLIFPAQFRHFKIIDVLYLSITIFVVVVDDFVVVIFVVNVS